MISNPNNVIKRKNYTAEHDPDYWFLLYVVRNYLEFIGEKEIADTLAEEAKLDEVMYTKEEIKNMNPDDIKQKFVQFISKNLFEDTETSFLEYFWQIFFDRFLINQHIVK